MLTIAIAPSIETVVSEDRTEVRFVAEEPFDGSEPGGKRGAFHVRKLRGPAAAAFLAWMDTVDAAALAAAIEAGSVTLDAPASRQRGAPRSTGPTFAALLAQRSAAPEATEATPETPKSGKSR